MGCQAVGSLGSGACLCLETAMLLRCRMSSTSPPLGAQLRVHGADMLKEVCWLVSADLFAVDRMLVWHSPMRWMLMGGKES